jgi:hypothetical protein
MEGAGVVQSALACRLPSKRSERTRRVGAGWPKQPKSERNWARRTAPLRPCAVQLSYPSKFYHNSKSDMVESIDHDSERAR